jgi:hypothetical protein
MNLNHFTGHDIAQSKDAGNAIADLEYGAGFVGFGLEVDGAQLLLEQRGDFIGFNLRGHGFSWFFLNS